jgi:cadmium resistance protein CadD (predicted permease)
MNLIPVVSILGLVILIPLTIGIGVALRARRWRKQVRASDRTELPALPARYRSGT